MLPDETKLNVWYISKYAIPPGTGSVGTRGFFILRDMARAGHTPVMITSDANHLAKIPRVEGTARTETVEGVIVRTLKTRRYTRAQSLGRILSWIDFERRLLFDRGDDLPRPDAVIVSSLSLLTVLNGLRLRRRYKSRLIFEVRDIWPLTIVVEGGFSARNPFVMGLAWLEKLGYRRADAIVGTMPNLSEHVQNVLGEKREVHCIPMGIEPDQKGSELDPSYVDAHLSDPRFTICHAGTVGLTNGLDTFFDCAEAMKNETGIRFLIVGKGDLLDHYKQRAAHLPNVHFAPAVPKDKVAAVLRRCDLLYFATLPSVVWRYGLSLNKLMDYMLAARPVIGSYSGYRSMVEEAGAGTMVPAADMAALRREILRYRAMDKAEREAIGARGRQWLLANRTYETLAARFIAIIRGAGQR